MLSGLSHMLGQAQAPEVGLKLVPMSSLQTDLPQMKSAIPSLDLEKIGKERALEWIRERRNSPNYREARVVVIGRKKLSAGETNALSQEFAQAGAVYYERKKGQPFEECLQVIQVRLEKMNSASRSHRWSAIPDHGRRATAAALTFYRAELKP